VELLKCQNEGNKDMRINKKTVIGWEGFKLTTPAWAAIVSNYLIFASIALFVLSGLIESWDEFIPQETQDVIYKVFNAVEKSFVSISGFLRLLGQKDSQPVNENMYGIPHDNG